MLVFVKDSALTLASSYVQAGDLLRIRDRRGQNNGNPARRALGIAAASAAISARSDHLNLGLRTC
jgi:hypothetical protein